MSTAFLLMRGRRSSFLVLLCFACMLSANRSWAQTPISGIVNSYYRVIEMIPAKACVRLNTTAGLAYGDKFMIIQMKGAGINTADPTSSSFGDTTALNNAGNYELGTICYIRSDTAFFVFHLLNQYTVADKVQLIKMPTYSSAIVVDTLKALPWNNTNGIGGVIAIYVDQDLELNAPIYADSSGYRGGAYRISSSSCNNSPGAIDYAYNANSTSPQNGAFKGEGIADVVATQSGGRGAPANGGGGGNNHNNGGGGGGNLTAGGNGGANSSTGTFNCKVPIAGKGGKALSSHSGKKIFAGGGGGAGHANNGFVVSNGGGHGGGIIYIRTMNLTANNKKISANGQVGGPAASDGASGAGAGGTIVLDVNNFIGAGTIEANGGQGGTEDDGLNINYCYGSGGGGSGGAIYFSGSVPAAPIAKTVNGGNAGPELNHDASCSAAVPSSAGSAGLIAGTYTPTKSLILASSYCSLLLPTEFISFTGIYLNKHAQLNWKIAEPYSINYFIVEKYLRGSWVQHETVMANTSNEYASQDANPLPGNNYYRVVLVKKSGRKVFSTSVKITAPSKEDISIFPNPTKNSFTITGIGGEDHLDLFDLNGKLVSRIEIMPNAGSREIILPPLSAGIYMLKIGASIKTLVLR